MRWTLTALLALSGLWAAGPPIGGYAGAFARIGADARSVALAGALVADINAGHLALINPASMVYVQRRELGLSYMALPLDRTTQGLTFATGLPPSAAVGISYVRAGDDNIVGRNSIGENTGKLTYNESLVALSFANRLTASISLGLNAKLLLINLGDEDARGFGLDLGILYHRPSGFNLGLRVSNLTGAYSWKVAASQGERVYVDDLPIIISVGSRLPWRHFTFFGQADLVIPKIRQDSKVVYELPFPVFRLAVEDRFWERYFVRGGLDHTTPTFGAGLRFSVRQPEDSRVDYSLSLGKAGEGLGHLFSWVFSL